MYGARLATLALVVLALASGLAAQTPTHIQSASASFSTNFPPSITATFGSAVTAGDLLYACLSSNVGPAAPVTWSGDAGTFVAIYTDDHVGANPIYNTCVYVLPATGGGTTITATSGHFDQPALVVEEFSNVSALDQTGAPFSGDSTTVTSTIITPTINNELILGTAVSYAGSITFAAVSPYVIGGNVNGGRPIANEYQVQAAAAPIAASFTSNGTYFQTYITSFKSTQPVVATPAYSPVAGAYPNTQTVSITDATSGSAILYCEDLYNGCTPATTYTSPLSVSSNLYLRAVGTKSGSINSPLNSGNYTIGISPPTASIVGGTYGYALTVALSVVPSSAVICYRLDGGVPTAATPGTCDSNGGNEHTYSTPLSISSTATLTALGTKSSYVNSKVSTNAYTITAGPAFHRNYPHIRTFQWTYSGNLYDTSLSWLATHLDTMNSGHWNASAYTATTYNTIYAISTLESYNYYVSVIAAAQAASTYWANPEGAYLHHTSADYAGTVEPCSNYFDFQEHEDPFGSNEATCVPGYGDYNANGALLYNGTTYTDETLCLYDGGCGLAVSDYLFIGYGMPFDQMNVTISSANTGTASYQYCSATSSVNGACTTWSTLTPSSDGTSGLHSTGQIAFLPPAGWKRNILSGTGVTDSGTNYGYAANTTQPKFWVRILVSGGSATVGQILGDNWVSTATNSTTLANCGGTCNDRSWCGLGGSGYLVSSENFKYNPSPGTACTAKFEYQARILLPGSFSGQYLPNYAYPDTTTGNIEWAYAMANQLTSLIADTNGNNTPDPNGVMWDNSGITVGGADWTPTVNYNNTDLYPCSPTYGSGTCTGTSPITEWAAAYRPNSGTGLYQLVQTNQGSSPGFEQTCNAGIALGGPASANTACDVNWSEQANINYFEIFGFWNSSYPYYTSYDFIRDNVSLTGSLVGWYYPNEYMMHSPGPGGGYHVADMSNRMPMYILALHYMMQPGPSSMFSHGLGNNIYAFNDAYAKLSGTTTTTGTVSATASPSGVVIPMTDTTQLINPNFQQGRDTPVGCYTAGCRVIRICPAAAAANNTCDQFGEVLYGTLSGTTFTVGNTATYATNAITNTYPAGSVIQNFIHGALSVDWPTDASPPLNWHNVAYWDGMFPGVFYDIGAPDTTNGWCGVNAGTACPSGGTSNAVVSCDKQLTQYTAGCAPGDRDMLYRVGTAASSNTPCNAGSNEGCAPTWRRDYVNPNTGTKTVVLMRLDNSTDWTDEPETVGPPIDLQSGAITSGGENLFGPYNELFADGTLATPINSCIAGQPATINGNAITCASGSGIALGHQVIYLRGTDGVVLVQAPPVIVPTGSSFTPGSSIKASSGGGSSVQ
jgi:hypothetical protein